MRPRLAAGLLAALAWSGLLLQLFLSLRSAPDIAHGLSMYFGYFTVLTNVFVAVLATRAATMADGGLDLRLRGCAVASIAVVGIGYHLLLRHAWNPQGAQWLADVSLHYIVPLAASLWWIALPPRERIAAYAPLRWLAWPALYAAYALVRGAMTGFYPYPFIDMPTLGAARVALNVAGLALVFLLVAYVLRALAHWRRRTAA